MSRYQRQGRYGGSGGYGGFPNNPLQMPLSENQRRLIIGGVALLLVLVLLTNPLERTFGRVLGLILGFTIHEWAHAYTAMRLGDRTAFFQGRVSFNPLVHLDPIGTIFAVLVGFGWAKPVPTNPRAFYPNERQGVMIVALAGPVSNLFISVVIGLVLRFFFIIVPFYEYPVTEFVYTVIGWAIILNLTLFLFNFIPLAPLDGWKIMLGLLPPDQANEMAKHEQVSMLILMLLLILGTMPGLNLIGQL